MTKDVLLNWYEHLMLICIDASFCIYLFMLLPQTPHSAGSLQHWVRSFFFEKEVVNGGFSAAQNRPWF